MHIAIVEDDPFQRQFLTMLVESGGHRAASFSQGRDFINALDTETFDLLLLDWMLPEMSGDQILAVLRQRNGLELPVIVVTALRQGADDYIVKPPKSLELLARMEALTRRARNARVGVLRAGPYEIDRDRRTVTYQGAPIDLTQKEFDLAVYLFQNSGKLLSRVKLLEQVWGISSEVDTRTVDTHVSRVRRKLKLDSAAGWKLLPVYGFGYRLDSTEI